MEYFSEIKDMDRIVESGEIDQRARLDSLKFNETKKSNLIHC